MTAFPDSTAAHTTPATTAGHHDAPAQQRRSHRRHYIMTAPSHYAVHYRINPWMDPDTPVDLARATAQWTALRDTYRGLGHTVDTVAPAPGLPDMVYAANAGLIVGRTAIVARFKHHQRDGESAAYAQWLTANGYRPVYTRYVNEGQGDLLLVDGMILAGTGFRTDVRAHAEVSEILNKPVVTLELVDPRYYHLDTALAVLDDATVAYYPPAFSAQSRARLRELFPDAIVVGGADAEVLGLNVVSDGHHVIIACEATGFADQLRTAGFQPVTVEMTELLKGGGSVKCCTLEAYS